MGIKMYQLWWWCWIIGSCCCFATRTWMTRCVHGDPVDGKCQCRPGYYGDLCQIEYHCRLSGEPARGIKCDACEPNWSGEFCDQIICGKKGIAINASTIVGQRCECQLPYSGQFCNRLRTADIYRYYNSRLHPFIPIGILIVIPIIVLMIVCNRCAKQRRRQRLAHMVERQHRLHVNADMIEKLIYSDLSISSK